MEDCSQMKNLHFTYRMDLDFASPIENHRFTLKCIPDSDDRQTITDLNVKINPEVTLSTGEDSFGNIYVYGHCDNPHKRLTVSVEGNALTGLKEFRGAPELHKLGLYRTQTGLTAPGEKLKALYNKIKKYCKGQDVEAFAGNAMEELSACIAYSKGTTNSSTTAEEALLGGLGVCQDYSHIMLSLLRLDGIPCRYVVGMMTGEGESHAWIEFYCAGKWIGADPTNHKFIDDDYISISTGRDAKDCRINRGIFNGSPFHTCLANVTVTERFN